MSILRPSDLVYLHLQKGKKLQERIARPDDAGQDGAVIGSLACIPASGIQWLDLAICGETGFVPVLCDVGEQGQAVLFWGADHRVGCQCS